MPETSKNDQLKIMFSLIKEFSDGILPEPDDYDMDRESFGTLIESMQIAGYIRGAKISRTGNKIYILILDCVKVEIKGLEYLHEHSKLMETYKGLKEVKSWIPFMNG